MRNMSFSLTTAQLLAGKKTVTRRHGSWRNLQPGERIQAIEKGMGLKKGEQVKRLCVIEIVSVRREPLGFIDQVDVIREGFPQMTVAGFVRMFCEHHKGCTPETEVVRIEFKIVEGAT